jgi:general stress protein YciG
MSETTKSKRGFGRLSAEERQRISRKGGVASHAKGTGHEFTRDEARAAGQRGGSKNAENRRRQAGLHPAPRTVQDDDGVEVES